MTSSASVSTDFTTERLIVADEISFSEIISAFSVALDITQGHPHGHSMRTALIGMRLADQIQLPASQRHALFYALLLKDLGCSSNAAKISHLFGTDDHTFKRSARMIDWTRPFECVRHAWANCLPSGKPLAKFKLIASLMTTRAGDARRIAELRCHRGAAIARKLQLPEETALAIYHLDELWNGRGNPGHLQGDSIPLLARICGLAQSVEVHFDSFGAEIAVEMAQGRRGRWFDPELVDLFATWKNDTDFWSSLKRSDLAAQLQQYDLGEKRLPVDDACLDRVAESFAMVVDAKSPWTHLHSTRVAEIATDVSRILGCNDQVQRDIRRAGLLHDIGKLGVSNAILDKPGKPTTAEFEQIKKHPLFTQQILQRVDAFGLLANIAGAHHERLDGRGYHQQRAGVEIPIQTRILTVADIFEAMTAKRPYRDAMSWDQAIEIMTNDEGSGVDRECLRALIQWAETTQLKSRVEQQLNEVDCLICEL